MSTPARAPRDVDLLHALLNELPTTDPRTLDAAVSNARLRAAAAGASREALRELAADSSYVDGYRVAFVRDLDPGELIRLVKRARARIGAIDREIAELQKQRAAIADLLDAPGE